MRGACSTPTASSWPSRRRPASCTRPACGARSRRWSRTSRSPRCAPATCTRMNDPYRGGIHANDILVFRPVFADGRVAFFAGTLIHVADVGGVSAGGLAALATDTFAEGLMLPAGAPVRGRVSPPTTCCASSSGNSRTPDKVDRRRARARRGSQRHRPPARRAPSSGTAPAALGAIRAGLASTTPSAACATSSPAFPAGTYRGSFTIDGDGFEAGQRFEVNAAVTLDDGAIDIDFAGTSDQSGGAINASFSQTHVGRDLRGALPRRPEHPDERRLLPRRARCTCRAGRSSTRTRPPRAAGASISVDRRDRGDPRRAGAGASRPRASRRAR